MKTLYEVLVPTIFGDTGEPISTKHHKEWDKYVQTITGGLTIFSPGKGKWTYEGTEYPERIIPVRVMCEEKYHASVNSLVTSGSNDKSQITKIINFTLSHYRQKAVMFYVVSNDVQVWYSPQNEKVYDDGSGVY